MEILFITSPKLNTMKTKIKRLIFGFLFYFLGMASIIHSQTCFPAGGFSTSTGPITTTTGGSSCFDQAFSIGDNITVSGLIIGNIYTVSLCGEGGASNHPPTYNSYIGLWNAAGTPFISESLGGTCGTGDDEELTFTATATSHLVILRDETCNTGFSLHDLCVTNNGPLPVELLDFHAKETTGKVKIVWRTASELDNEGFQIQRSADGKKWGNLAFVPGHGTTHEEQSYNYNDERTLPGMNYYRLRQMDFDGQSEYSKVISVEMKNGGRGIRFFPNPAAESVRFALGTVYAGEATLTLYDGMGRLVKSQALLLEGGAFSTDIGLCDLPAGVYLAKVQAGQKQWQERLMME